MTGNQFVKGLAGINIASVIRLCRNGPRDAAYRIKESFRAVDPFGRCEMLRQIPEIRIEKIAKAQRVVIDATHLPADGSLTVYELLCIAMLARDADPKGVLEIGTYNGSTTLNLALNLSSAVIHTLDLPLNYSTATSAHPIDDTHLVVSRSLGQAFARSAEGDRIRQHLGDSATYDLSLISDPLSFFFIDGAHTYEYVRSDTLRCAAAATGQSTFLWHDCDEAHPGVTRWLAEMITAGVPVRRISKTALAFVAFDASAETMKSKLAVLSR